MKMNKTKRRARRTKRRSVGGVVLTKKYPHWNMTVTGDFPNSKKNKIKGNARLKLYKRYLPKIFENGWNFNFDGNNAVVTKH